MSEHRRKVGAILTPHVRRWAYRMVNAGLALAVAYQLVDGDKSALWLLFANAALGLADANVPTTTDGAPPEH